MPELPEVETMRRGILAAVGGTITHARPLPCPRKPIRIQPTAAALERRLVGRQITAIDRIGKRVVVRLDSGDSLVFEPRMTGLVLVSDPPSLEHLRFELQLRGSSLTHVQYWDRRGLGSVRLLDPGQLDAELGQDRLGIDALIISPQQLRDVLHASRRPIKVALLDQKRVAGVGNLYASELLHVARIDPRRRCDRLSRDEWQRIHTAMLAVLQDAILHEGSTLSDGTYRNVLNDPGGYQNHHRVYDREGEICPSCQQVAIRRLVQAQRSTFFCPTCQRPPSARPTRSTKKSLRST
jgi:formamidopyrimidine-DNA glycosylase